MKIKEHAFIAFVHFACTFILGLIIFYFSLLTMPLASSFWVAVGVGIGRFFIELIKSEKLFDKIFLYFKKK